MKTGTTRGWTYDANGNRLTETGASASTYTIASTNNRVSSISGALPRTYGYDTAGNVLTYASITATYNNRGRMKTLTNGAVTATYVYNALGQFVKQSGGPSGTVLYVYDEAGHILGEYTSTGALVQETIWMGDTPVATIRPGSPVVVYYVNTDHLDTPRRVTRPSDNKLMWTWYSDAFGVDLPNENPASGGTFKYNLRFPGQLYDSHAGLNQNYFRDYDPAVGRYVESDPIGVKGGVGTYGYAWNQPTRLADPRGLVPNPLELACVAGPNPVCGAGLLGDLLTTAIGIAGGIGLANSIVDLGDKARQRDQAAKERDDSEKCKDNPLCKLTLQIRLGSHVPGDPGYDPRLPFRSKWRCDYLCPNGETISKYMTNMFGCPPVMPQRP